MIALFIVWMLLGSCQGNAADRFNSHAAGNPICAVNRLSIVNILCDCVNDFDFKPLLLGLLSTVHDVYAVFPANTHRKYMKMGTIFHKMAQTVL